MLQEKFQGTKTLSDAFEEASTLHELADEEADLETLKEANGMFVSLEESVRNMEVRRMLSEEADECDAVLKWSGRRNR